MGLIHSGPPTELILKLKEVYKINTFIETGTYTGDTAAWAAAHFSTVLTIEYSKAIYEDTVRRLGENQEIIFLFGDSRIVLREIVPTLTCSAIFWLDSHWSGGNTYGKDDECPLIEELSLINEAKTAHFLLIDDARLFLSPPPRPHQIDRWPGIDKVIEALKSESHKYYIVVMEDVILAVPDYARDLVADYCQDISTQAWENYFNKMK